MLTRRAPFVVIEGVDGAGKSSHIPTVVNALKEAGFDVVQTNEPGGTKLGFELREKILLDPMTSETEVLLAFASRAENIHQIINPALQQGKAVVCDRFTDSTFAYQVAGGGVDHELVSQLEDRIVKGKNALPDLVLLFDLPCHESLRRLKLTSKDPDKFESKGEEYFEQVRAGYLKRVEETPQRYALIDALVSMEAVAEQVKEKVADFIEAWTLRLEEEVILTNQSIPRPRVK